MRIFSGDVLHQGFFPFSTKDFSRSPIWRNSPNSTRFLISLVEPATNDLEIISLLPCKFHLPWWANHQAYFNWLPTTNQMKAWLGCQPSFHQLVGGVQGYLGCLLTKLFVSLVSQADLQPSLNWLSKPLCCNQLILAWMGAINFKLAAHIPD
jgi:hypothetical protein